MNHNRGVVARMARLYASADAATRNTVRQMAHARFDVVDAPGNWRPFYAHGVIVIPAASLDSDDDLRRALLSAFPAMSVPVHH